MSSKQSSTESTFSFGHLLFSAQNALSSSVGFAAAPAVAAVPASTFALRWRCGFRDAPADDAEAAGALVAGAALDAAGAADAVVAGVDDAAADAPLLPEPELLLHPHSAPNANTANAT
jgi:hypothetical protein